MLYQYYVQDSTLHFSSFMDYGMKVFLININQISPNCKSIKNLSNIWNRDIKTKTERQKAVIITSEYICYNFVKQLCLLFPKEVDVPGFHVCSFESERKSHR